MKLGNMEMESNQEGLFFTTSSFTFKGGDSLKEQRYMRTVILMLESLSILQSLFFFYSLFHKRLFLSFLFFLFFFFFQEKST